MKLNSNFHSFYDHCFDGRGETFHRIGGNVGPGKREQFRILEEAGFKTPPHGLFNDIIGQTVWDEESEVVERAVIYEDEFAHCGEGKRMSWRRMEEFDIAGHLYCSAFVGDCNKPGESWRRLQIGKHVIWIEYKATESWMSNCGDGTVEVIGVELNHGYHPKIQLPLFAIDFVLGRHMYAIDFNTAPGVPASLAQHLSAPDIVAAIEEWHVQFS